MKLYTKFRSLLYHKMFVNFWFRMYCIYTDLAHVVSVLVGVRRVTLVIVHNGHQDVILVAICS